MEKGERGNRFPFIRPGKLFAFFPIPGDLVETNMVVSFDAVDLGIGIGVEKIEDAADFTAFVRRQR